MHRLLRCLLGVSVLAMGCAQAQTLESLNWLSGVAPPTARLNLNANVRYLRQVPEARTATDMAQIQLQIISADAQVLQQMAQESVRLTGPGLPQLDLSYQPLPNAVNKLINLRLSDRSVLRVKQGPSMHSIDIEVLPADASEQRRLPLAATHASEQRYVVILQSLPKGKDGEALGSFGRVPSQFQDYAVFTQASQSGQSIDLVMGYFRTQEEAMHVQKRAVDYFATAQVQESNRVAAQTPSQTSAVVSTADAGVAPPPVAATTTELAQPQVAVISDDAQVGQQGAQLLQLGQQALQRSDFKAAEDALNRALLLPPHPSSQLAQELIGQAWEGLGSSNKAKAEYELYLKLYPTGPGTARVSGRLAALNTPTLATHAPDAPANKQRLSMTGSISQYYYGGNTKTDSLVNIAAGIDQNTLSRSNQSVLVSSWDATARYLGDESETKLVMRGSHSNNFRSTSELSSTTQGLISSAYLDYRDLKSRVGWRVGRQSAIGGSMFGLFDGVSVTMPYADKYKLSAMLGVPANMLVKAPSQELAGVMIEADQLSNHWGGSLSLMQQKTEGISDRRAVGMEARYFGDALSAYAYVDYDTNLQAVNAFTMQGSMQGPYDTTITVLADDRRAPSLQLSDALISSGQTSLKTLLELKSLSEVQSLALATAARAKQTMISVSRPVSEKWQASVDVRRSEIGALPAVGNFEAMPATGAQYNLALQLTGSNLYSDRDIHGFNLSLLSSELNTGRQISYNNLTGIWGNQASLEPSIRFYTQTDNTGTQVKRLSTGLRLSYKLGPRSSLMGEGIYETSQTDGPSNHETNTAFYYYIGYRYDFQ